MNEHPQYPWDHYSDQPRIMRDKKLKRKIYVKASIHLLKSGFLLLLFPFILLIFLTRKSWRPSKQNRCIGLSIHVESECPGKHIVPIEQITEMVDELGVREILVRIKLADSNNFTPYIEHIDALARFGCEISVNIIQDRTLLEDEEILEESLRKLLPLLKGNVKYIHVGNAYNRRKWAFYHFGEYYKFFQTVRSIADEITPEIKLIGGAVIDFELPPFFESFFNFRRGHYDGFSSQLYVDRRGAPENKQGGFNFLSKINLIALMNKLSWKTKGELWITEANWPLKDTEKFSPCKGSALVNPQTQADYLTRSYLIAMASANVRTYSWHQLIAPGYGLVDNRANTPIKRPSYHAFKTLNYLFRNAEILHFSNGDYNGLRELYSIKIRTTLNDTPTIIQAFWSNNGEQCIHFSSPEYWIDQEGNPLEFSDHSKIAVSSSVIYAVNPN